MSWEQIERRTLATPAPDPVAAGTVPAGVGSAAGVPGGEVSS